jgi:GNAT superfamily N-acetyltransferase
MSSRTEGENAALPTPPAERFEAWLQTPVPLESSHPQFDARRARPEEFDAIYALVDEVFGGERGQAAYDWLYRGNPFGLARCWMVIDRASGRLIASRASWPWPLARAGTGLSGRLTGDSVVAPEWQRQGIGNLLADTARSHPWRATDVGINWPNEKSHRRGIKRGHRERILGPVPHATVVLKPRYFFANYDGPVVRALSGIVASGLLTACRGLLVRGARDATIEAVTRFDNTFDEVTAREMTWPGFWSPHSAVFLNWRYLDHPLGQYVALALVEGERPTGYAVVRLVADEGWLMEFAAPQSWRRAGALLLRALAVAREAGCSCLRFSTAARWRHWRLFHAAGFVPTASRRFLWIGGEHAESRRLDVWQWVPGDMDHL